MPDDCGHLEARYINKLRSMQASEKDFSEKADAFLVYIPRGEYWIPKRYTRTCPYCRTDPKKDTCVNCGAPQKGN